MSQNNPSPRLFIGSLPYKFTESELLDLFISEGKIVSIKIIKNRWGKSRGMGYVQYENLDDAVRAKQKFHNFRLPEFERTIIVDYAQPDPFQTEEGRERHEQAQARRQKHHKLHVQKQDNRSDNTPKRDDGYAAPPAVRGVKRGQKIRQTVFNTRAYGSRVGAKFASRNKKKK